MPNDTITITEPPVLVATASSVPADCSDPATGSALADVTGGTQPYTYLWSDLSVSQSINNINPGNYFVTVLDANGCFDSAQVAVTQLLTATISGTAQFSMGYLLQNSATVFLYKHEAGIIEMDSASSVNIGSGGSFLFDNVLPGDYSVKVVPDTSVYPLLLNTWYDNSVNWVNSITISAGCEDVIDTVAVNMLETHVLSGMGSFSGYIYYWQSVKGFYEVGEPVEGAEIFVEQQPNDEPLAQGSSDVNGAWAITGLEENSSYDIHVDIAGLPLLSTYNNLPVTSIINNYQNLNFYVDTTNAFGGIFVDSAATVNSILVNKNIPVVYPNPVNSFANVRFNLSNQSEYSWELYDESGKLIEVSSPMNLLPGVHEIKVPVRSKGVFVLVNKIDNNIYVRKILSE